jgi:hypothetical protein
MNIKKTMVGLIKKESAFTNRHLSLGAQLLIGIMISILMIVLALKYGLNHL